MEQVPVIDVRDLVVDYRSGGRVTHAVKGVTFQVQPGECVGFIGANGAGKSTTMKTIMGFIFPTGGSASMFGVPAGTVEARRRVGYLPEVAQYYPFMKARELLELYGGLHGVPGRELKTRIPALLEELGLAGKGEVLLKNFSKGMQQRVGIAQAIIADPEALILDELSSGLDPVGRYDLRQVLLRLKERGRTIFFSSHELSEIETLCDRVIMIHGGRVVTEATVAELMKPLNEFEVKYRVPDGGSEPAEIASSTVSREGQFVTAVIRDPAEYARAVAALTAGGIEITSTSTRVRSLEDYFIDLVRTRELAGEAAR